MKIISNYNEDNKCPSCNWRVYKLFCFEGQKIQKVGMCGECFCEYLEESKAEIKVKETEE